MTETWLGEMRKSLSRRRICHLPLFLFFWKKFCLILSFRYGDKTPKSILARAFGILWITVGVSLSGIFTASLITGMTQSLNDGALSLEGKNVRKQTLLQR